MRDRLAVLVCLAGNSNSLPVQSIAEDGLLIDSLIRLQPLDEGSRGDSVPGTRSKDITLLDGDEYFAEFDFDLRLCLLNG